MLQLRDLTALEREEYEERAAIMEYCGDIPRALAERKALELIERKRSDAQA